jgi:CheY-like chemotaxis protein
MNDRALDNLCILVVEDEYMLAMELRGHLTDAGASIFGPVSTIKGALELLDASPQIDCAILDTNLQGEMVFPVAERLQALSIPFLFTTGYDASIIPSQFKHVERFGKPTHMSKLCQAVGKMVGH